jgi:hypothetical protein
MIAPLVNQRPGHDWYVSSGGNDRNPGTPDQPLASPQAGLSHAHAGDTIHLEGNFTGVNIETVRDGEPGAPITMESDGGTLVGATGLGRIITIQHSNLVFRNLTLDGQHGPATDITQFTGKGVYAEGTAARPVHDLEFDNLAVMRTAGECVRLKHANSVRITVRNISSCGRSVALNAQRTKPNGDTVENGEGIYVGTAPDQIQPGEGPDQTSNIEIRGITRDSQIATGATEGVELKQGTGVNGPNYVHDLTITNTTWPSSAGINLEGTNARLYGLEMEHNSAGVRIGTALPATPQDGTGNSIRGNTFGDAGTPASPHFKFFTKDNAGTNQICGNQAVGPWQIDTVRGEHVSGFDPGQPC